MTARQVYRRALAFINERDGSGAYHADVSDFEFDMREFLTMSSEEIMKVVEAISSQKDTNTKSLIRKSPLQFKVKI